MRKRHEPSTLQAALHSRAGLLAIGWSDKKLRTAVKQKTVRRVHHGWYISQPLWDELFWEQQHLAHVMAVVADAEDELGPVVAHESAAVVHALPLYRECPPRVHVLCIGDARSSSTPDVFRHTGPIDASEITEIDGIRCTSLARTVVDVARTAKLETAVACADAALRRVAVTDANDQWAYDEDAANELRREMHAVLDRMPGARGARRARWVIDFADGRAQLPGESVSRLRLVQIGFCVPDVQVRIEGPGDSFYVIDIDAERWWAEFDGNGKYLDSDMRNGASIEQVILAEKKREDWIRARTDRLTVHLADEHVRTVDSCVRRLAEYGIQAPRRRPTPDPGPPAPGC